MARFLLFLSWCMAGILGLAGPGALAQEAYRLQPGDTIEVSVLEDPALSKQALILPDGRIALPIAGTIMAAGLTPEQLSARVRARLSKAFVTPPTVTVAALGIVEPEVAVEEEAPPERIFVLGEVQRPGGYEFEQPMTVLQALAMAGGPGPFAARARIQVRRLGEDGVEQLEIFNYEAVEEDGYASPMAVLGDGDVIVVPERGLFD